MPIFLPFCFLCSFCSMLYELTIAKTIAMMTYQVVLWESLTMGTYIGAIGIGLLKSKSETINHEWKEFLTIEIFLFMLGIIAIPFLLFLDIERHIYFETFGYEKTFIFMSKNIFFGMIAQTSTLFLGFFSGRELKLILELGKKNSVKFSSIYATYYGGALCGTLVFTHIFSLVTDPLFISYASASINLFMILILLFLIFKKNYIYPMIISLIVLLFHFQCFKAFSWFNPFYLKNKYYNTINWDTQNDLLVWQEPLSLKEFIAPSLLLPAIERIHTSYQTIDIATDLTDKTKKHFTLYLDGHYQFNTQNERSYHETMAYTPMLLFKHVPNKILILGGGDGLLARDLLKNNQAQITIVEIDPQVTALAALKKHTLSTFNDNALNSNRVTLVHDDAFTWLRSNKEKFDAIYMDFPLPFTYDGIRLYSADFFKMVKNRLNMQGYIVIDVLIKSIRQKNMIFETLYYAGYKTLFGFKNTTDSFITGTIEKKVLNRKHFQLPFHMSSSQEEFEDDFNFFTVPQPKIFSQVNDLLKPQDFEVF